MIASRAQLWSRYLIYFILAVLPLERIPSLELTFPVPLTLRLSQVAGLILILINLPWLWRHRREWLQRPWIALSAFLVVCLVSSLLAAEVGRGLKVLAFTGFVVVLAWTISLRFEREKWNVYLAILTGSAVVTCLFGLYQFFGDLLGLSTAWTGLRDQYTSAVFGFPRIQSTGLEPLYYDNFLLIPAALMITLLVRQQRTKTAWVVLMLFVMIIFANVSRGAMAAIILLGVAGVVWSLLRWRWQASLSIVSSLVVGAIMAGGLIALGSTIMANKTVKSEAALDNFTKQATNLSEGESAEFRTLSRRVAWDAFREHPVLGIGPGNFGVEAHRLMPSNFRTQDAIANNEPLELLAETGILGFGSFIIFALLLAWEGLRHIRKNARDRDWITGLLLALVAIGLQYQTFSTLYITHIWVAFGLVAGLVVASRRYVRGV